MILVALCALSGCVRLGFDKRAPGLGRRRGRPRCGVPTVDGPRDAGVDAPTADGSRDTSVDAVTVDATPTLEASADGPRDVGVDSVALPSMACAPSMTPTLVYGARMVVCGSTKSNFNQCDANARCNLAAGWSLCTATQFLAWGGKLKPALNEAWLRSCMREGTNITHPTDAACSSCVNNLKGLTRPLGYFCGTGKIMLSSEILNLGITTSSTCRRLGANAPVLEAYWVPIWPGSLRGAAVCCK